MKKSNKSTTRKIAIVTLMLLVVCMYFVAGTYAKYTWKGTATGSAAVAKWQVGLGTTQESTADVTFTVENNPNVANGKIAPGCTAKADIVVNPNGSEVSVDYKFKIDATQLPEGINMSVSSVTVDGTEATQEGDWYKGTIELNGKEKLTVDDQKTVTVSVTWTPDGTTLDSVNDDGYGSNADTVAGIAASQFTIPVTVLMEQHVDKP